MKNIIDLIYLKTKIDREIINDVLTETLSLTKETLQSGGEVYWPGLCRFTWKTTKKGKKPKVEAETKVKGEGYVDGSGFKDILIPHEENVNEHYTDIDYPQS